MTHVNYDLEAQVLAEIERLEREAQQVRERIKRAAREEDKRQLNGVAEKIRENIAVLLPNLS